jgi:hypothetical protein
MHLRTARELSKGTLMFTQCDPGFCIWPESAGSRPQDHETFINVPRVSFAVLLALIEIEFNLLHFLIPPSSIVL